MSLSLSEHQIACALLVAEGLQDKEIAQRIGCAVSTVKAHLQFARLKLGARNRVELAVMVERGMVRRVSLKAAA